MNGNIYRVEAFDPYFLALMALHITHWLPLPPSPQTNNILLITWGQTMSQEMLKFPIIGLTPSLKWALDCA